MIRALAVLVLAAAAVVQAQPKRVLYLTHTAGFRHDCIPLSAGILERLARDSGRLEIVHTEDINALNEDRLRGFDAVLFFTSGELPLSAAQRASLLDFVNRGGGFGGVHSATDTLYGWPEYGELIGGYFAGHPWVQDVRIDVEDPDHPAVQNLAPAFRIVDEIYQFRALERARVRVLMTLDTASISLTADGVNPGTTDFPLAWTRVHGSGRVFYTALGHFDGTWTDERFQRMMLNAMLWLTRQSDAAGEPRPVRKPEVLAAGNAASVDPPMTIAPGSLISLFGSNLTPGSTAAAAYVTKLAGASVTINGAPATLIYASPTQINAMAPENVQPGPAEIRVSTAGETATVQAAVAAVTPGIFAVTVHGSAITIWATGVRRQDPVEVAIAGRPARVLFAGPSPEWPGLFQVNAEIPTGTPSGATPVELRVQGQNAVARHTAALP
jgi:type 1 glutamine amidotransferase